MWDIDGNEDREVRTLINSTKSNQNTLESFYYVGIWEWTFTYKND